ncbi:hypothetical protein GS943_21170 [Rhodococcus hoagii]|nr:hypothetical protein [Prescottella equi]
MAATTISAVLALLIVRDRPRRRRRASDPSRSPLGGRPARAARLLAVGSMRLIAMIPFSVVNYCCGVSSVRVLPYTLATVAGILPARWRGASRDALTGRPIRDCCVCVGHLPRSGDAWALFVDARTPRSPTPQLVKLETCIP